MCHLVCYCYDICVCQCQDVVYCHQADPGEEEHLSAVINTLQDRTSPRRGQGRTVVKLKEIDQIEMF